MTSRPGVEHQHQPIVPGAKWRVRCNDCGAAFDSAAPSAEAAVAETLADHEPAHRHLTVEAVDYSQHPVDYSQHPLHVGRPKGPPKR